MQSAIFLDRDGVLNACPVSAGRPYAPMSLAEFHVLPGVAEAAGRLKDLGYILIVATNQPDVGAGRQRKTVAEAMNDALRAEVPLDDVRVCYHIDDDDCPCRKPKPGMIVQAAAEHGVDLQTSFMIGDRWRDVGAGKTAGCRTVFIDRGYNEKVPWTPDWTVSDLTEAANLIAILRSRDNGEKG